MQFSFAPLDGITSAVYRCAHHKYFPGIDRYYAPFISPTMHHKLTPRELRDLLPEYNENTPTVPQLLTKNAGDFLWAAGDLSAMGYREVNLNLGCPSGTVVSKGKGSGFLAHPKELEHFLDEIFEKSPVPISIKTRLGLADPEEFGPILELYRRYPLAELIVHPRVQKDLYRGSVRLDCFARAAADSPFPVCYNGDLNSPDGIEAISAQFPQINHMMLGRGLVADPGLITKYKGGRAASAALLEQFHNELFDGFAQAMNSRRNAMLRMKEIWFYHIALFDHHDRHFKRLRKAEDTEEFARAATAIFRELPLRQAAIPHWQV